MRAITNPDLSDRHRCAGAKPAAHIALAVVGLLALDAQAIVAAPPPAHRLALQAMARSAVKSREAITAGQWQSAHERSSDLLEELEAKLAFADGTVELFAQALLDRAIAGRKTGQEGAATWEYAMARALLPSIETIDPAPFGKGGEPLGELGAEWTAAEGDAALAREVAESRTYPPKSIGVIEPRLPFPKLRSCSDGATAVEVVVDARGRASHPRLVETGGAPFDYALLAAARRWAFHPFAAGEPPAAFVSGIVFHPRNCER